MTRLLTCSAALLLLASCRPKPPKPPQPTPTVLSTPSRLPDCSVPNYPGNIEPKFIRQEDGSYVVTDSDLTLQQDGMHAVKFEDLTPLADGSFVVSGEDLVIVMMWIEQLALREAAEAACIAAGQK